MKMSLLLGVYRFNNHNGCLQVMMEIQPLPDFRQILSTKKEKERIEIRKTLQDKELVRFLSNGHSEAGCKEKGDVKQ